MFTNLQGQVIPSAGAQALIPQVQPNNYPFRGLNPNIRSRPLVDAAVAGGQFLGNIGNFMQGVQGLNGGQGLSPLLQSIFPNLFQGTGGGTKPNKPGGGGGGGGLPAVGGGGAPFGTQTGNYGPLTGAILRHTPQSVLMNTSSPLYDVARDFYLGPARPSFAQAH